MELKNIRKGDFITFTHGDAPYYYHTVGKVVSLSIPAELRKIRVENLDWKEKLDLKGHVTIRTSDGDLRTLMLCQVINGCERATSIEKRGWNRDVASRIDGPTGSRYWSHACDDVSGSRRKKRKRNL